MDQAMRPESPPQFTAILDKVPYTSVTPKPVAEYQVYYRIYAGANEPLTYSVYLKYEGMQGEKILPMYILVNNKRLAADQFDAENRNFQAIDGYNQVCVRYMSKTYGEKEECGFGKTTSSAAIDYLSKAYAKNEAGKGINSAQDCVPSGSSYSSPSANYLNNAGKIIAGGFSSGVMETGVVRICSGVPPGKESEWAIVGECWEGKPDEGRSKGYCWLYTPSADRIIKEHSANLGRDMEEFYSGLGKTTQQAVDSVSEYVDEMGMNIGYETSEEAESALSEARSQIEIIKRKDKGEVQQNYIKAIELLQKVLRGSLSDKSKVFEARSILAELYELWGTKNL
jgi:hypothetical protein